MQDIDKRGIWWLPHAPENTLSGAIKFSIGDWPRLELDGSFTDITKLFEDVELPVVHGLCEDGRQATLFRCVQAGQRVSFPGMHTSRYAATVLALGAHLASEDDALFVKMRIAFDRLAQWTRLTGFKGAYDKDKKGHMTEFRVAYSFPETHDMRIRNHAVRIHTDFNVSGDRISDVHLRQGQYVEVEPPEPSSLQSLLDGVFHHIQNFISLGMGLPVYPTSVIGTLAPGAVLTDTPGVPSDKVEILYFMKPKEDPGPQMPHDILFSFRDIASECEQLLCNWIAGADLLKPVYDLYFGTLYASSMYRHHRFLSLAQAVESYHRRRHAGSCLPADHFARVEESLREALSAKELELSKDVRETLVLKLQWINELSLRRRLKELIRALGESSDLLIPDAVVFTDSVVATRNFLTHYNPDLEESSGSGEELDLLAEQLQFLLELSLLRELGMTEDRISRLAEGNQRYLQLRRRMGQE